MFFIINTKRDGIEKLKYGDGKNLLSKWEQKESTALLISDKKEFKD